MNSTDLGGPPAAPVTRRYDAIVVGARCAGAATAMLLAGKGYDVLLVDRASFPSDTVSTHVIHPPGLTALRRWGLLDDLVATGCPWLPVYTFDFGPMVITGTPSAADGTAGGYAPRRIVLDELLVRAAAEGRRRAARGVQRHRADRRRRPGRRRSRACARRHGGQRVRPRGHRRRRGAFAGGRAGERAALSRGPGTGQRLLRVLVRRARRRGAVDDPARSRFRHDPHQRRSDAGPRRLAAGRGDPGETGPAGQLPARGHRYPRRPARRRAAGNPGRGRGGAEQVPQTVRAGLGAGR